MSELNSRWFRIAQSAPASMITAAFPKWALRRPDDSIRQISPEALNNLLINNVTFSKNISSGSGGAC